MHPARILYGFVLPYTNQVDKFTDMARNLNTVGVVLTGGGADIASDGKFKINFS